MAASSLRSGTRIMTSAALRRCTSIKRDTTAAISAKNTSRFVRFFFAAKSSDAKLSRLAIDCPFESMTAMCHIRKVAQRLAKASWAAAPDTPAQDPVHLISIDRRILWFDAEAISIRRNRPGRRDQPGRRSGSAPRAVRSSTCDHNARDKVVSPEILGRPGGTAAWRQARQGSVLSSSSSSTLRPAACVRI